MKRSGTLVVIGLLGILILAGCQSGDDTAPAAKTLVVNSTADRLTPVAGETTLREAMASAGSGDTITFAPALNGKTIDLEIVGAAHSILKGEVFTFIGSGFLFNGFQERDYGRSALYARKNLTIDASNLPAGITLNWNGGTVHARVLAVYGNLTLKKVTLTSGFAEYEATGDAAQPYTLGRGGALAVWGLAVLEDCVFSGNRAAGDLDLSAPTRDRGAFGGAIYVNSLQMSNCVVAGNRVSGFGAAGGGIYTVAGADGLNLGSSVANSTISGNRVTGQHAYGGGIFSEGGGPGNLFTLTILNSTIARNLVEDHPDLAEVPMFQFFYRGGGVYMSNGHLVVASSTIVENEVTGHPYTFSDRLGLDRPNMGGGGVAATIGDAHVVEDITLRHSIVAGNRVGGVDDDLFSGSLLHFFSAGYNLVGTLNCDFMLAPVPLWESLSRRHWPKAGDQAEVALVEALDVAAAAHHASITSAGTDAGAPALLWYPPRAGGPADDVVPIVPYSLTYLTLEDRDFTFEKRNGFLQDVLDRLAADYGASWASDIGTVMGDPGALTFYGPSVTWPSNPENTGWIAFWRDLDAYLASKGNPLGPQGLAEGFWASFPAGLLGGDVYLVPRNRFLGSFRAAATDQLLTPRPLGPLADIGAIEID